MEILSGRLAELKNNFSGKRIAIIGDLMLDSYFQGEVKRISPEAPVPVVEIEAEEYRFGGAANAAYNILTLGGIPLTIGVIGDDNDGKIFNELISEKEISSKGIFTDTSRPTTAKARVIAESQHVVRIDKESKINISDEIEQKILKYCDELFPDVDAIIVQDYNKGLLTSNVITNVISKANKLNKLITVDPKYQNFFEYKCLSIQTKPEETEDAFGIRLTTHDDISDAGKLLFEKLNAKYILLTLGEEGMALFENSNLEKLFPTKARKVADVSGAGDTVISTLTMALTAGARIDEAVYLANYAGGLVCQEVGIVPIELNTLFNIVSGE